MLGMVKQDGQGNKYLSQIAGATLGQGVPLGAWCSFEKDVAPSSNWLMAGTTFDATVYPALNLYLGTNVVPSRYDHNRPSEWEEVASTNTFTPAYDGFMAVSYYNSGVIIKVNDVQIDIDNSPSNANGNMTLPFKKGDVITFFNVYDGSARAIAFKVRYYTHPLFIKATSIASDTDQQAILAQIQAYNTYSTEETLTGKTWIDGKPIYRKCGNTEATGVWGGAGDVSLNLSWFKQSVVGDVTIINMEYHQTGKSSLGMRGATITTSGVSFNFPYNTGLGYSPSDIIVFEYTKTTD